MVESPEAMEEYAELVDHLHILQDEREMGSLPAVYRRLPQPVRWQFTREEFDRRLQELEQCTQQLAA